MSIGLPGAVYLDPARPVAERVADLIARMTLEEKAAQMICVWEGKSKLTDDEGRFSDSLARTHFGDGNGIGQVGRPGDANGGALPRDFAELTNTIQRFFVENSRLGIPVLFHDECLHGFVAPDATSFSQPIGLASTFNTELIERLYHMTATEARACGVHQSLGPVVDVARDPRWGRVEETFGEDPHLVGEMGAAAVRGYQGEREIGEPDRVIATLKHFAAHGQPESGNNCAPVSISERHLRETFLAPFEKAIRGAGAMSVMASYNEIDGVPSHASTWLLDTVLRGEWQFDGTVVSDYYAIRELFDRPNLYGHNVAADREEAATAAIRAGVNIELPDPDCYLTIIDLVRSGKINESRLDELVAPLLSHKFELGLFDSPYVEPEVAESIVGCDTHRSLAKQAALETITLLKNESQTLPIDRSAIRKIAVIGPNADRELLGGYSGRPKRFVSVLEGLKAALGDDVEVLYHEGCKITIGGSWEEDMVTPSDPSEDRRMIAEATDLAAQADLIVLAVGGNEQTSREAYLSNHLGDRTDLQMVGRQDELVEALAALNKPIVSLLFNGRPLAVNELAEKSSAVLECWYLGQETGQAVADVLFGDHNPSGRLPITIPRSVGHIPAYYNYRPSARRGYLFDEVSPLYPFGYGLSYTTFHYEAPVLTDSTISLDGSTTVSVRVTNSGDRQGEANIQLYIRDLVSSTTRPVKELKGFAKVALEPSESQTVQLPIGPEHLAFWNIDKEFVVEPGEFEIQTGPSSAETQSVMLSVTS